MNTKKTPTLADIVSKRLTIDELGDVINKVMEREGDNYYGHRSTLPNGDRFIVIALKDNSDDENIKKLEGLSSDIWTDIINKLQEGNK